MNGRVAGLLATTLAVAMVAACGGSNPATGSSGTHTTGPGGSTAGTAGTGGATAGTGGATTGTGGSTAGTGGAAAGTGGGSSLPPHEAFPQMPDQGGPRLTHPQVITITFAKDPRAAAFESFASWIVGSQWLTTVGAEYGVNAGAVAGVSHRPETPPATMTSGDIESYLITEVTNGSIPRPAAAADAANALYIFYFPATTTGITTTFVDNIMAQSCTDFVAYHGEAHGSGLSLPYIVVPDCGLTDTNLTAMEMLELFASHELIEASTDPFPISHPAWQLEPDPTSVWYATFQFEVEVGDMCEVQGSFTREAGFVAQRTWSNAAAAAGKDPCVPAGPGAPYFNTTATPDAVQHVAAGGSFDYTLKGWATAPVADWNLLVSQSGSLKVTTKLSAKTLNSGGTATLHVTVPATAVSGTHAALTLYSYHSTANLSSYHSADDVNPWFMVVDVP